MLAASIPGKLGVICPLCKYLLRALLATRTRELQTRLCLQTHCQRAILLLIFW